jgi:hypothetical protein
VEHLRDVYERTDEARRRADLAERRSSQAADQERRQPEARGLGRADRDVPRQPMTTRRGPHTKGSAIPARRTIEIRGRTVPAPSVPRGAELDRRRPPRRAIERVGARPDRLALWALLMGIVLIVVAVGTSNAPM